MSPADLGLTFERFDYTRVGDEWAVLRVLSRLTTGLRAPSQAQLVVRRGEQPARAFPARAGRSERRLLAGGGSELLWRALFAVPFEVVEQPDSLFALSADGHLTLALPAPSARACLPGTLTLAQPVVTYDGSKLVIGQIRSRAAAVASAVVVSATATPAAALAAGGLGHKQHAVTRHTSLHKVDATGRNRPASSTHQQKSSSEEPSSHRSNAKTHPAASAKKHSKTNRPVAKTHKDVTHLFSAKAHHRHVHAGTPGCTPMATAAAGASKHSPTCAKPHEYTSAAPGGAHHKATAKRTHKHHGTSGANTPTSPTTGPNNAPTTGPTNTPVTAPTVTGGRAQRASHRAGLHRGSSTANHRSHKHGKRPPRSTTTGGAAPTLPETPAPGFTGPTTWTGVVSADPALTGALGNLSEQFGYSQDPPNFLIPIYMEAGKRYDVPWEVLAAINAVETDYGRDLNTSSAGAIGWMQFEPSTWKQYGVAADGHRVPNPYDPRDAIFSAARYLAAAGAAQNISLAIFAYNHAPWYVEMVLSRARAIAANVQFERQAISKHGVMSVFFSTGQRTHPTARYRGGLLSHYDRLIASANMVSAANFPYLYGGGHEQPARFGPFDCSGSVSYVLQQAGYKVPTTVSGDVPVWKFPAGPGRVTIFYNAGHTFMRIGNRYFGTSGFARPGGGAGWFDVNRLPVGYLSTFHEVHVPRLGVNSFAPPRRHIRPGA